MHASPQHSCSWPFGEGMSKIPVFFPPLQPQLQSHLCFVGSNFLLLSSHQQNPGWEALFSLDSWAAEKRWLQAWGRPSHQRDPWLVLTGCRWVQKNGHVCSFLHHTPVLTSPQKWSSSPSFSPKFKFYLSSFHPSRVLRTKPRCTWVQLRSECNTHWGTVFTGINSSQPVTVFLNQRLEL